jgi:GntR family histidine utilization transcriptional repressor
MTNGEERPAVALRTRITDYITGQITAGAWLPGDKVATERSLMAQFGASRMTVHNALRELANRGFLARRKGSGSFVAPPRPYRSQYDHLDILEEIAARGGTHSAKIIRREIRAPSKAEAKAFGSAEPLFHAVVLHCEDGQPVELEDRLLDPVAVPVCVTLDLTKRSLFSALMLVRPYREGSETIRPVMPAEADRRLLQLAQGEPALEIVRKTCVDAQVITVARLLRVRASATLHGCITSRALPE